MKLVSESRVTWATSVPISVFLGLFVLKLGPMYATDRQTSNVRQTDVRQKHHLIINKLTTTQSVYVDSSSEMKVPLVQKMPGARTGKRWA